MKHHIWYLDFLRPLHEAAEALIVARNLAREAEAEGEESDLFRNLNMSVCYVSEEIDRTLEGFSEDCCTCEGPNETYPRGYTCEADALMKTFRLSPDYKKGDRVFWLRKPDGAAGGDAEELPGTIKSIRVAPDGATIFKIRLNKGARMLAGQTVELTWRDIKLDIEHVKNDD